MKRTRRHKYDASKRGEDFTEGGVTFKGGSDAISQAILKMGPKPRKSGIFENKEEGFGFEAEMAPVSLQDRFGVPPFTILDARQGYWQRRKRAWLSLGIKSEIGRGDDLIYNQEQIDNWRKNNPTKEFPETDRDKFRLMKQGEKMFPGGSARPDMDHYSKKKESHNFRARPQSDIQNMDFYSDKKKHRITGIKNLGALGISIHPYDGYDQKEGQVSTSGTSIFDPVLCELIYRWFCPLNGHVLDPFAGGSVRGVVASVLYRNYTGIELRKEQVEANYPQWDELLKKTFMKDKPAPAWIHGDSQHICELVREGEFDLVFSCPPYGDLEVYSDDPADISNMKWDDFLDSYYKIIAESCKMLKDNRFACYVVGDFRDKTTGFYKLFPSHTIAAFQEAGLELYNDCILITSIGSLPIRAGRQFAHGRKLGKAHQNILVFYKGDQKDIKNHFAEKV
jgi:DNA modification methylase